ncbi:uncharacterized protein G2W53_007954 [Senna tora]|uniref:Uncharacterized protein n=1 Tax=Senna tora TaxID=362788 RepID=A0A834X7W4_9FABA|nr:uncharacterized protein G2W53_007954 [Senna tora]
MARPLISQYLSMLGILLSGSLSLIQNSVRVVVEDMDIYGERDLLSSHGVELSSNRKGHVPFLCFEIYIFSHSDQLGEVLKGNDKHQIECLDHNVPRPQGFLTNVYVSLECKPREAEMEMCEKGLLVSSPLPCGQPISFKMKLRTQHPDPLDSLSKQKVIPRNQGFLPSIEGSPPLTLSSSPLTLATQVFKAFRVCHPKVRQMLVAMLLDSLSFIRGVALNGSSLNW